MHIVVCIKQIPDPEIPPHEFEIDPRTNRVSDSTRSVMDSYAENALEMAIQLRNSTPGSKVTALCLGDKPAEAVLRRAFAFTADAAVRVWDPTWGELDGLAVGYILSCVIKVIGGVDLVMTGRQAGDVEEGLVGPVVAEEMGVPCITLVSKLSLASGRALVTREAENGFEVVSTALPAVFTVTSSEVNVPRYPKAKDQMLAKSKSIKTYDSADLGADPSRLSGSVSLVRVYVPETNVQCEIVPGDDGAAQASELIGRLQLLKLL